MPSHHANIAPESPRRARLFRNGRNQALRIPRDLEFPGNEVVLHKEDDRLIVEPVARRRTLAEILPGLSQLTEDLPEASDSPAQPEDIF
jgi:antitoxin VapB